jgi:hypothetical protein
VLRALVTLGENDGTTVRRYEGTTVRWNDSSYLGLYESRNMWLDDFTMERLYDFTNRGICG